MRLVHLLLLSLATLSLSPPALEDADFPDPFVVRDGARWFAFATGARGRHVQVAASSDLATWTQLSDALPILPRWAARGEGSTWAPSVLRRGDRFVLYYTTRDERSGFMCISRATSARAEGPYVDATTEPFVCQKPLCGSIDPSPFVDERGAPFLLWKSDENAAACHGASRLWAQHLTSDGLGLEGTAAALVQMDRAWERPLVEAPSMIAHASRYYLFYSSGWYESTGYAIAYATCTTPLGPCEKPPSDGPLVRSDGVRLGPGGQEPFEGPDAATWLAFHAWTAPHASYASGGARSLRVSRLDFESDVPVLRPPRAL